MSFERPPKRWLSVDGLRTSIYHFVPDALFFRPVRDQPPAQEDKLTFTGFGLSNHRDIPAWSHVVTGEVELDLREAEVVLNIGVNFAYVTSAHGLIVETPSTETLHG